MKDVETSLFSRFLSGVVGFFLGLISSLIFYEFVLSETGFHEGYKTLMFLFVAVFLSFGFAFSTQMRCLTFLCLTEYTGKGGRRAIMATILILVIAGPTQNIGNNGEEVLQFMVCMKDMLWEILNEGKDLIMAPIQHLIFDIKTRETELESYNLTMLKQLMKPINKEVEDYRETYDLKYENDYVDRKLGLVPRSYALEEKFKYNPENTIAQHIETNFRKKLTYRCEAIFTKGSEKCYDLFHNKYQECEEAVTTALSWLLCWPMKLTVICDLLSCKKKLNFHYLQSKAFAEDTVCDMTQVVEDGFGERYLLAQNGIKQFSQAFKIKVHYQALSQMVNMDSFRASREDMLASFLNGKQHVELYMSWMKKILLLTYLLVIFSGVQYQKNYLSSLSFDNVYLTSRFKVIDRRRKKQHQLYLLPLRSYEKSEFISLFSLRLPRDQRNKFFRQLGLIGFFAIFAGTMFAFDYVFTSLLTLVREHGEFKVSQEGEHVLHMTVEGTGLLAQLMRDVADDIRMHQTVNVSHYTETCLPNPRKLLPSYMEKVILLFLSLLFFAYLEAYVDRWKHVIANYFYPQRAKKRTVWLYNETLKKRKRQMAHLKRKALENANSSREQRNNGTSCLRSLASTLPVGCCCLKIFMSSEERCLLCQKSAGNGALCPDCGFSFCSQCLQQSDNRCLFCLANAERELKESEKEQLAFNLV